MSELSPRASAVVEAYRTEVAPTEVARASSWEALNARLQAGEQGPELADAPVDPATGGAATAAAKPVVVIAVVGVLMGVAAAAASLGQDGDGGPSGTERGAAAVVVGPVSAISERSEQSERVETGKESPAAIGEAPAELQAPEASDPPTLEPAAKHRHRAVAARSRTWADGQSPSKPAPDDLGPEMALVAEARASLGRGDARAALDLLNRHRDRFRNGVFAPERDVSRITALCALGRGEEASRAARRFVSGGGESALVERVRNSCADLD
jgi:hypothetical protein